MNIFVTSKNPQLASRHHCDVHLNKMILETTQLLCNSHRVLDGHEGKIFKKKNKEYVLVNYPYVLYHMGENNNYPVLYFLSHMNHPCSVWTRKSVMNYKWLYNLLRELHKEYEYRFNKTHKSSMLLNDLSTVPDKIKSIHMTSFPTAFNNEFEWYGDTIEGYQQYMIFKYNKWSRENMESKTNRKHRVKWTNRKYPFYLDEKTIENIEDNC